MILLLPAAALLLQQGSAPAKLPDFTGPKKRAVVASFKLAIDKWTITATAPSGGTTDTQVTITQTDTLGAGVADMLVTELIASKRFLVYEKKDDEDLAKAIGARGGAGTESQGEAPQAKALGAQVLLKGSITELSFRKKLSSIAIPDLADVVGGAANFVATVGIDLKVIDIESGLILDSVQAIGKVGAKSSTLGFKLEGIDFKQTTFEDSPIAKAMRAAVRDGVQKVCARLDRVPWESRVALVSETEEAKLLYLAFGSESNIPVGTVLEVFRPGRPIVDPQSGEVLGQETAKILGKCRVQTLNPKFSIAAILEGSDFQAGDAVRLPPKSGS
ncbi:MAG: hypothetical protein HZC36_04440 [Armatimonadetes bacterium]|nr:hypothetical protein [Armatimonadota bacterium]